MELETNSIVSLVRLTIQRLSSSTASKRNLFDLVSYAEVWMVWEGRGDLARMRAK